MNTGKAYILRSCNADMTSYGGFVWPRAGAVECPDWEANNKCGNGLHGFLWGEGDGRLASFAKDAVWLVAEVSEWIDLGGKVKFPRANVVFAGDRADAAAEIVRLGAKGAVIGYTANAGYKGTATAGYKGTANAGDWGTANAGDWGTATAGHRGTATAGNEGTATAGDWGIIQIRHWDGYRYRIITGYVGEDGIKPNVAYRCEGGKLVEAA
jgi:hypothetical protein